MTVLPVSALVVGVSVPGEVGEPALAMLIPELRVGDRLEIHHWGRNDTASPHTPGWSTVVAVEVLEPEVAVDMHGQQHTSLAARVVGGGHAGTMRYDLETRHALTNVPEAERSPHVMLVDPLPAGHYRDVDYDTRPGPFCLASPYSPLTPSPFWASGRLLDVARPPEPLVDGCTPWPRATYVTPVTLHDNSRLIALESERRVVAGELDGKRVIGIRSTLHAIYQGVDWGHESLDVVVVDWYDGSMPHWFQQETTLEAVIAEQHDSRSSTSRVVSFERGEQPIRTGCAGAHGHSTYVGRIDGDPDAFHPEDGTHSAVAPLHAALGSVAADRTLTGFREWRSQHPEARLIGAAIGMLFAPMLTNDTVGRPYWGLLYGSQDGEGYKIRSFSHGHPAAMVNRDDGPIRVFADDHHLDFADVPPPRMTIGSAERLWRTTISPDQDIGRLNVFRWGYSLYGLAEGYPRPRSVDFDVVVIGHSTLNADPYGRGTRNSIALATVDLAAGRLLMVWGAEGGFGTTRVPGATTEPADGPPDPPRQILAAKPPPIGIHGITTSMAVIIVGALLAYFWQPLKAAVLHHPWMVRAYANIRRDDVLDNENRQRLFALIAADPGVSPPELADQTGIRWSTLVYHLGVLQRMDLVVSLLDGRHRRYFAKGRLAYPAMKQISALRHERTRKTHAILRSQPGLVQQQLAERLQLSSTATIWHLKRLERAGLASRARVGRAYRYYGAGPAAGSR